MYSLPFLLAGPALAQDQAPMQVLVPEFTATSVTDLSVAFTMTEVFLEDLRKLGVEPVPAAALATRSGDAGEACADNPSCPGALLGDWPEVPMVVVASVSRKGDRLDLRVAFYSPGDSRPISELTELIQPGQEFEFTSSVALQANQVLELLYLERGDGPPATWELPGQGGGQQTDPPPDDPEDPGRDPVVVITPKDPPPDDPVDPVDPIQTGDPVGPNDPPPDDRSPGLTGDPTGSSGRASGRVLGTDQSKPVTWPTSKPGMKNHAKEMGVSFWAYQKFRESGETDPEVWLRKRRVRSQQLGFELQVGRINGALDQTLDYRAVMLYEEDAFVAVDPGGGRDEFYSQALRTGESRGTMGLGATVNLNSHVELGFNGGLFFTEQCLDRSYNLRSNTHDLPDTQHLTQQCASGMERNADDELRPVVGGYIQPRLRVYPYGLGFVKPYLLGGFSIFVLPGFEMGEQADTRDGDVQEGDPPAWSYGNQQGLLPIGFTGGGGVMFDVLYRMGIFVEAQYTMLPFNNTLARWEGGDGVPDDDLNRAERNLPDWAIDQTESALPWIEQEDIAGQSTFVVSAGLQVRF